jgi:guanine deaminase
MDNPFMARAIQLSLDNVLSGQGGPFGAVIVQHGSIVAEGVNRVTATNDPTAHAEVVAIRQACAKLGGFELKDCELYSSCEPCPMCLGAIYWARPERVYYACTREDAAAAGFDDAFIYDQLHLPPGERSIPMHGLMRAEARVAFEAWRKLEGRVAY